jgi:WD40 repeat protein
MVPQADPRGRGFVMSRSKRWKLPAIGCIALALLTVLAVRPGCTGRRRDPADEERVTVLNGHRWPVQALAFSPDGSTLVSGAYYPNVLARGVEVTTWEAGTGTPLAQRTEQLSRLRGLAFAPGGRRLAAIEQGRLLWLWDTADAHEKGQRFELGFEQGADVVVLAFSGDGGQLALADLAKDVTLVDATSSRPRACCKGQEEAVYSLAFSPDTAVLAGGGRGGTVWLWDAASGEGRASLRGHSKPVHAVAFSHDGRLLASGDWGGVVRLWDVATRVARPALAASEDEVSAVAFAPDARTLAVATGPVVQLWEVDTGRRVANLSGHQGKVLCLAYSPDGTRLASGSYDRTVRLWEVARIQATPGR